MLKWIIFGGLSTILLAAYFLQGKKLSDLQAFKAGRLSTTKSGEKKKENERKPGEPLYRTGTCLTKHRDGWEFIKVVEVTRDSYKFINCHKYQGCGKAMEMPTYQIEFEYKEGGRKMPCP